MADAEMTLQEAAELLSVHYMTAYRYVRLGLLPAQKVGSSWRVRRTDVDRFRSADEAPATTGGRRRAPWAERLEARLVAGDGRGAWGVVEAALSAGAEPDELYLDVIAPALASIGNRWAAGELDVAAEHRASGIALRIIGRLGPRFVRRGRTRGTVVLGAPPGERHFLPVALVADLVRGAGWDVSDLGADVPVASFVHLVREEGNRLAAVGLSVTTPEVLSTLEECIAALRTTVPTVPILVGGRAVEGAEHAQALGADGYAADGRAMVQLLEEVAAGRVRPAAPGNAVG